MNLKEFSFEDPNKILEHYFGASHPFTFIESLDRNNRALLVRYEPKNMDQNRLNFYHFPKDGDKLIVKVLNDSESSRKRELIALEIANKIFDPEESNRPVRLVTQS